MSALYCQYKEAAIVIVIRLREVMAVHKARTGETLTYAILSERTGLSRATIESIASREGYNASLSTIECLCVALQCEPSELLEMMPNEKRRRAR